MGAEQPSPTPEERGALSSEQAEEDLREAGFGEEAVPGLKVGENTKEAVDAPEAPGIILPNDHTSEAKDPNELILPDSSVKPGDPDELIIPDDASMKDEPVPGEVVPEPEIPEPEPEDLREPVEKGTLKGESNDVESTPKSEAKKEELPFESTIKDLRVISESRSLKISERKLLAERIDYLEKVSGGEVPGDPVVIEGIISFLSAEKTVLEVIEEHSVTATRHKDGPQADPDLKGKIAEGLDDVFEKETFLAEQIEESGTQDTLQEINDIVFDENGEIDFKKLDLSIDELKAVRERLANKAEDLPDGPKRSDADKEYLATQEDLGNVGKTLDQLIANLEALKNQGGDETITLTERQKSILLIEKSITSLLAWKITLEQVEPDPDPLPKPKPDPDPVPPVTPIPIPVEQENKEVLIASVDEVVKGMAWRIAESRLTDIVNGQDGEDEPGLWNGVRRGLRASWAKLGERRNRSKFFKEAVDALEGNQSLRVNIQARLRGESVAVDEGSADNAETYELLDKVIEQMKNDVLDREENGENLAEAGVVFSDLFQRHLEGEFPDRKSFEAAARQVINGLIADGTIDRNQFSTDKTRSGEVEGLMFATNLWEIAEANRKSYIEKYEATGEYQQLTEAQKEQMKEFISSMGKLDIRLASKFSDSQEYRAQRPDRRNPYVHAFEDRMEELTRTHPILGTLLSPTFMGVGVSTGLKYASVAAVGAAGLTGGAAMFVPIVTGMAVGGVLAGVKRSRNLKYDRGTEQRREAMGQEVQGSRGQVARSEALRARGFSGIAGNAEQLTQQMEAGDAGSAIEAAALLQAQRELRAEGRPADLIFVNAAESERTGSNITGITDLKLALKNFEAKNGLSEERLAERVAEIKEFVNSQDKSFESYRTVQSVIAGGATAVVAGVLGIAAQELPHVWAMAHGQTYDRVTALSYLAGRRPQAGHEALYTFANGQTVRNNGVIKEMVAIPGSKAKTEVVYTVVAGKGQPIVKAAIPELPKGYTFNGTEIVHKTAGVDIHTGNPESWVKNYGALAKRLGLDTGHASWIKHADQGTAPIGNSFSGPFNPRANSVEVKLDFIPRKGGGATADFSHSFGKTAFGDGHHFKLTPASMKHVVLTISPHDRAAEHASIMLPVDSHARSFIPPELAKTMITSSGRVKGNMMITLSQVMGHDHGKDRLFEIATDYGGKGSAIHLPGKIESIHVPIPKFNVIPAAPTIKAGAPIAIPVDFRRPIASVRKSEQQTKKDAENGSQTGGHTSEPAITPELADIGEEQTPIVPGKAESTAQSQTSVDLGTPTLGAMTEPLQVEPTTSGEQRKPGKPPVTFGLFGPRQTVENDQGNQETTPIEFPGLERLVPLELSRMYSRMTLLIGSEGLTADEKRAEFKHYVSRFNPDVASSLTEIKLRNGSTLNVDQMNNEQFSQYVKLIMDNIERIARR